MRMAGQEGTLTPSHA